MGYFRVMLDRFRDCVARCVVVGDMVGERTVLCSLAYSK